MTHFADGDRLPNPPIKLIQLFESQVNKSGGAISVVSGEQAITYTELNERANKLAAVIVKKQQGGRITGTSTARTIETVVSLLAILKAGLGYVPLDATYPPDRLKQIILESGIDTCLAPQGEYSLFQELGLSVILNDAEYPQNTQEIAALGDGSLTYVLFTSGSTGKPKGVCMGNDALVNLLQWQQKHSEAGAGYKTLQYAPLTFDVSFQEIFATLTTGGTLVLVENNLRLDPVRLLKLISEQQINRIFLPFVALQYLTEAAGVAAVPTSLREVMTAGEQLKITPQIVRFFKSLPGAKLFNQYGPTESHVVTELVLTGDADQWPALPGIGAAIDNTEILILDEGLKQLPDGETGELCISGICLAEGYLNRPDLTAEKFFEWTTVAGEKKRIYRTGDLARIINADDIEYLGRIDNQVKIRGNRVEPGEIEVLLNQLPEVSQAVVVAREYGGGQKRLVAYLISSGIEQDTPKVKKQIADQLPDYMVPSGFIWLDEFPKTSSGKVDRKALPAQSLSRPELNELYRAPLSQTEKRIAELWIGLLEFDKIGVDDNFFDLGGNSLLAINTVSALRVQFGYDLPVTRLYQSPTIAGIAAFLDGTVKTETVNVAERKKAGAGDIAVIAMSGRFPGAKTVAEFWENLKHGRETTTFFTAEELDESVPESLGNNPLYVKARGVIDDPAAFDAAFFHITPRMAELMDPQQRLFMTLAWEALEAAGYYPEKHADGIGVWAGCANNTYYYNNVLTNPETVDAAGAFNVMTLNEKDYIATRTAYELDLKGPAVAVYSACSTSLLAITQAVDALRNGYCKMALAGGATVTSPLKSGHVYNEGAMLSRDGHCRPFDAAATGTVFSDGAGVVLLKPLEHALADGDIVYAVIKGTGVNNDGGGKGSFTAPNSAGQAGAIASAIQDSGIAATEIGYIEAHGTATPLGDPIEIEGLKLAFGKQEQKQYCAIGSVKSNFGHLTAAAGVAGFIKAALCLHNRQLVPSLFYESANPAIDFIDSPFYVNTTVKEWASDGKRSAGVSSFGVGGTNVHVILQEAGQQRQPGSDSRPMQLITWSAKTVSSRDNYAQSLQTAIKEDFNLPDLAYSLNTGRTAFNHRRFEVAADAADLNKKLSSVVSPLRSNSLKQKATEVAFMFPGQGAQYVNMGKALYEHEPAFRTAMDECAALIQKHAGYNIIDIIYPQAGVEIAKQKLTQTLYIQPALFCVEYALAKLWMNWGIQPGALLGHSIGEFVAAHLAGVFSLDDALLLITTRAQLINNLPAGRMLAVRASHSDIKPLLPDDLSIGVINSHNMTVISGDPAKIEDFAKVLAAKELPGKLLNTSHALHSGMMEPAVAPFQQVVSSITLNRPRLPVVSSLTGSWLMDAEATDSGYWASHMRNTVNFAAALATLTEDEGRILLETGPGTVTSTLTRNQANVKANLVVIPGMDEQAPSAYHPVLNALGKLWLHGITPDWQAFYANERRNKVLAPSYAFDNKNYWLKPGRAKPAERVTDSATGERIEIKPKTETIHIMRTVVLANKIREIFEGASGINMSQVPADMSFAEAGFDSLLLTQIALSLKKEFGVQVTFRKLYEEYNTVDLLAGHLDSVLPAHLYQAEQPTPLSASALPQASVLATSQASATYTAAAPSPVAYGQPVVGAQAHLDLINQQILMLAQQMALIQGAQFAAPVQATAPAPVQAAAPAPAATPPVAQPTPQSAPQGLTAEEIAESKKPFGATARIERQTTDLSDAKKKYLDELTSKYNARTAKSKAYTQKHRNAMADPRVVSGFRPTTKEIVYPLVVNRSKGSRVWDIDGNEYVDALNGFGSNFLGYNPDFLKEAFKNQIDTGYEIGPQHELAGEVCDLICEFTGFERSALCNTGSEAVLGAMRMARTVTGRSLIVAFAGSYHGINDEVLVRGSKILKTLPAAAGILPDAVQNMLILDYGEERSLEIIRERGDEIAAVLVETVQSRRPEFRPVEFLKKLRQITKETGSALVFDEVITGFRSHPGGAQAYFGIKADIGTYGKVIGGGMPIGAIAGIPAFMDALDGGTWQYGDDSMPEVGVTYFAGTFVRHPLALAGAKAILLYMKEKGKALQDAISAKTDRLAASMNAIAEKHGIPVYIPHFASLWKIKFKYELAYGELLFTLMRHKGIHIWDIFPCFLTEAHTDADVDAIINAFKDSVEELIAAGFLPTNEQPEFKSAQPEPAKANGIDTPPVPGARLGRDAHGNPAWFVEDAANPGKYLQVNNKVK